jgi:hypothetical protein
MHGAYFAVQKRKKKFCAVLAAPKMTHFTRLRGFVLLLPMLVGDGKTGSRGCDIPSISDAPPRPVQLRERMTVQVFTASHFAH